MKRHVALFVLLFSVLLGYGQSQIPFSALPTYRSDSLGEVRLIGLLPNGRGGFSNRLFLGSDINKDRIDSIVKAFTNFVAATTADSTTKVISFKGRIGRVTPDSLDYSAYYAAVNHTHSIVDVTGLQASLDTKQPLGNYTLFAKTNSDSIYFKNLIDGKANYSDSLIKFETPYHASQTYQVKGNYLTNESQTLGISGNQLSISGGNTVTIPNPDLTPYTLLTKEQSDSSLFSGLIATNTTRISSNTSSIGTLSSLTTTDKSNLVNAINEVKSSVGTTTLAQYQIGVGGASNLLSGSSNFTFDGTLLKMQSPAGYAGSSSILEIYSNTTTLRTKLQSNGAQVWYLNSSAAEVGSIAYSTPASMPGIVLFNASGTGRSQISLASTSGGLAFGATTSSSNPTTSLTIGTNGTISMIGSVTAAAAVARSTYINPTLIASANNDVLIGLDVAPTFSNGAFTGVANYFLRAQGKVLLGDGVNGNQLTINGANAAAMNGQIVLNGGGVTGYVGMGVNGLYNYSINRNIIMWANGTGVIGLATAQAVIVGNMISGGGLTVSPSASAVLQLEGTTKGFLTTRMTTIQRDAISAPAEGLEIYNLDTHAKEFFNGTVWKTVITN